MRTTFAVFNPDLEGNFLSIFVLGTDSNLWLEHGPFGNVPPGRVQVPWSLSPDGGRASLTTN